jgi:hypothetical protein
VSRGHRKGLRAEQGTSDPPRFLAHLIAGISSCVVARRRMDRLSNRRRGAARQPGRCATAFPRDKQLLRRSQQLRLGEFVSLVSRRSKPLLVEGQRLSRPSEILSPLGAGGMGEVYRANAKRARLPTPHDWQTQAISRHRRRRRNDRASGPPDQFVQSIPLSFVYKGIPTERGSLRNSGIFWWIRSGS